MAPAYKLIYFNVKALAEPIRLLLAHARVEYEDIRVEMSDWPNLKKDTPWGKLPILEEGDFQLSQSVAILKYLGRKHDYAGDNDQEMAKMDELIGALLDLKDLGLPQHHETEAAENAETMERLRKNVFPVYLKKFNSILEENGSYFVGSRISYADFYVFHHLSCCVICENRDEYPALKKHWTMVSEEPGVKEWLTSRPRTKI